MSYTKQDDFGLLVPLPIGGLDNDLCDADMHFPFLCSHNVISKPLHTKQTFRLDGCRIHTAFDETVQDAQPAAQITEINQAIEYDPIRILQNADPPKKFYRRSEARRNVQPKH